MNRKVILKSILAIVMVGFVLSAASCKKDNSGSGKEEPKKEEPKESQAIVGKWKYEKVELHEFTTVIPDMDVTIKKMLEDMGIDEMLSETFSEIFEMIEFTKEGKAILYSQEGNAEGIYTINGKKLTITQSDGSPVTFDYSISGTNLYLDFDIRNFLKDGLDRFEEFKDYKMYLYMITKFIVRTSFTKQ